MIINNYFDSELLFKCFCLWLFIYSSFIAVIEVSICYFYIPLLIHVAVLYLSLSFPTKNNIDKIFGINPRSSLRNLENINEQNRHIDSAVFSIAYRAAGFDEVENSLNAIKLCLQKRCKMIHIDLKITADNVGIICRKNTLLLSNEDESFSFKKPIEECDFSEIEHNLIPFEISLDVTNCLRKHVAENISTLEEVVSLCHSSDVKLMINVVHSVYHKSADSIVRIILMMFKNNPELHEKCVITSTNPVLLYKIRKHNSNIVVALHWTCYSEKSVVSISWLKNFSKSNKIRHCFLELMDIFLLWLLKNFIYRIVGISAIIFPKHLITPGEIEYWERKDVRCIAAVVNLTSEKLYYENALGIPYLTDILVSN